MASLPNVLPLFGDPDRKSCLIAVSNSIRRVKYHERLTDDELAYALRCEKSTVRNAENGDNLLSFDTIARLLAKYPEHCAEIRQLWEMRPIEAPTKAERFRRLHADLDALEKAE